MCINSQPLSIGTVELVDDSDSQSENKPARRSPNEPRRTSQRGEAPTNPDENQTGGNALWQSVLTVAWFVDLGCLEKHNFQQRCWKTAESITTQRVLRQFS